jgi:prepilin-type N-terminal cleavage/methylation domain-containing protein
MAIALSYRDRKHREGFTLVELLIVVIILAILAAIVVPQFATSTDDAKDAALDSTLANMRDVIDLYFAQHGEYPAALPDGKSAANTEAALVTQLSLYTDGDGDSQDTKDATHTFGPYVKQAQVPLEPMTNSRAIVIINAGSLNMAADAGDPGGWKYDSVTGRIIVNHSTWDSR